ncbi:opsin family protein NDAI_0F01510 [Naumovozyma dairenensis CBS 421]|uniref:30 kDa heat shock protein n=1 Tax=Naumovozyma dairenensis (strain ATCC 10597 / BCRC 20456 / CBS 421 / NBRC 0211 / NRRL Y-12639) TaxID=1071378 RepID=G0WCF9_NAUDC|nr:hypothetical protein NDAI_0F01510 [Naumovozyma dairenensis CBS 421]CCD25470.1 hypothetical protein NDAI_0F01510 [Naumovozyma dairenensis CBS 421]
MNSTLSNFVMRAGNHAIRSNPAKDIDFHLTAQGSDWLWAAFSIFGCFLVVYLALFFIAEMKGSTLSRYTVGAALLISLFEFFAYFTYASNLGWTGIQAEFNHIHVDPSITGETPGVRQIFYSKYVSLFLSWPALLFLIELTNISITEENKVDDLSAMELIHSLLLQMIATESWVVALLIGALIRSTYKWGYWVFGAVAMLIVQFVQFKRQFITLRIRGVTAGMEMLTMCIVWLYFICWGVSEGGNKIQPDSEAVFFGILDVCIFAILPAYLLFIAKRYGKMPALSLHMNNKFHLKHHDEEEDETEVKNVHEDSPRASGETQIPQQEQETEETNQS